MAGTTRAAIPRKRPERYRPLYFSFAVLNTFSFMLMSGGILTLIALSMGASGTYIGLLGSLGYLSFFFMPLGRWALARHSIVGVFGWSWLLRYASMIPAIAAPFLAARGAPGWGLSLLLAGTFGFNFFRGTGLIGNNPVIAFMGGKRGAGAFLSTIQILNSLTAIGSSAALALAIAAAPDSAAYAGLLAVGVASGIAGSILLLRLPEPDEYRPARGATMLSAIREAFADRGFRRYLAVFAPLSFAAGTARTFIVTHAYALYGQSEGIVMLYGLCFNLGIAAMGFASRRLMDRLGARPLYAVYGVLACAAFVPLALSPAFGSAAWTRAFLAIVNLAAGFALAGQENAGQAYFFAMVKREQVLDLAVVYYVALGLGGTMGSALGGVFLDGTAAAGLPLDLSYRLLYAALLALTALATAGISRLPRLGASTVRETLGVLLSVRDLKSIGLLDRLGHARSAEEEIDVIRQLGAGRSPVSEAELLPYLESPRFGVRIEALLALENLETLSARALARIEEEIDGRPWSTAYVAARIAAKHGYTRALPKLRAALQAPDYMLQGSAALALARLGDLESRSAIESMAATSDNPRVLMSAVSALELLGDPRSAPVLVSVLLRPNPPRFALNETILALAGLLGGLRGFYRTYTSWLRDEEEGLSLLLDPLSDAATAKNGRSGDAEALAASLASFVAAAEGGDGAAALVARHPGLDETAATVLADACLDNELAARPGFRFLLAAVAVESFLYYSH